MPMEKQGTVEVETQLAHAIDQTEFDSRYDETAKKMLANKQVLAQIMKDCVNEYSDCTVDDIMEKYIEGTPEVSTVGETENPFVNLYLVEGTNKVNHHFRYYVAFMSMIRTDLKSQQM